jgi:hypothetical protein
LIAELRANGFGPRGVGSVEKLVYGVRGIVRCVGVAQLTTLQP